MSNSPLVTYTKLSPNCSKPRNKPIDTITIHCMAGNLSVETCGAVFAPASREASSNYGIGSDGRVGMYVEEANRSWCTSSSANDNRAITIEVANTVAADPWPVSDAAYATLIDLVTDICQRNGIKQLIWRADKNNPGNMTVHRWYANKACPGDYLYNLHSKIAEDVNKRLGTASTTPTETPTAAQTPKVGDIVEFTGNVHYTSAGATTGPSCKPGTAKVTAINAGSKHPYHLIAEKGGGSTVYGWVDAAAIKTAAAEKTPEELTVDNALADGIITDRLHWLGVLTGTITPNRANIKTLMDNAHGKIAR